MRFLHKKHHGHGISRGTPRAAPGWGSGGPSAVLEAAPLVPLLVPHTAHGLDERLVGVPLVPVPVLALLEDVLAAPVPGILVTHPPVGREAGLSIAHPTPSHPLGQGQCPHPHPSACHSQVMLPGVPPVSPGCSHRAQVGNIVCQEGMESPTAPLLAWWVRARSHHPAPGTLPWSLLLPVGQGKGGSKEGTRDMVGMSSTLRAAAPLQRLQVPLPPPWADQPQWHLDRNLLGCPLCPHPYVPFRALTLATRSWKPCAHRLGTSSSTISILRPVYPTFSNRWILWSALSWGKGRLRGCPQSPPAVPSAVASPAQPYSQSGGAGGTSGCRCCGCWTTSPSGGSRPSPARTAPQRRPGARSPATCRTPGSGGCSP